MSKPKLKITILIAILLLLLVIIFLFITKKSSKNDVQINNQKESIAESNVQNNNKKALTLDEFKNKMEGYGFKVVGPISHYDSYSECTAYDKTYTEFSNYFDSIQFRFCKYSSKDEAKDIFNTLKSVFKNNNSKFEIDLSDKFIAIESNNRFAIVSIIGDTVLNSNVDIKYKGTVREIFNKLGY